MGLLDRPKSFYAEHLRRHYGRPVGARRGEIGRVEREAGFAFPKVYREYLEWMGQDTRGVFVGSDAFVHDVVSNTAYLPTLLEENGQTLSTSGPHLVFFLHQGYIAGWLDLSDGGHNPPCWLFSEASQTVPKHVGVLADFLMDEFRGALELARRAEARGKE